MPWWGWIILGAIFLTSEVIIGADFFLVFIGAGALIVGLIGLTGPVLPVWAQWIGFAVISVVSLLVFRSRLKRILGKSRGFPSNDMIGEAVTVKTADREHALVELRGSSWKTRSADGGTLAPGDRCVVERVEGVTLVVRKST